MTKQKSNTSDYKDNLDLSTIYEKSRILDFDKLVQTKDRFRNTKLHWEQIPRANDSTKPLQEKAVNLLSAIVHNLQKNNVVILNQDYLSRITKCSNNQNANLLKQLGDILDISYHPKLTIKGKAYYNYYLIRHTEKGYPIIQTKAALLAQRHFVGKVAKSPKTQRLGGSDA